MIVACCTVSLLIYSLRIRKKLGSISFFVVDILQILCYYVFHPFVL